MIVRQALHMVVQRKAGRRRQKTRLAHAATRHLADAVGTGDQLAAATQCRAHRRAQALAKAHRHAVKVTGYPAGRRQGGFTRLTGSYRRIEQARAIQVHRETALPRQCGCLLQVTRRHGVAVPGVFQAQQAGTGEVAIIGFDGSSNVGQRHLPARILRERLRLNAAEHRSATALVAVGVGHLTDDVLVPPAAMRHQAAQVALGAGGHKQRRLETEQGSQLVLQRIDTGVIAKHIVAHRRGPHGIAHSGGRAGHGVATQVNNRSHLSLWRLWNMRE